MKDLILSLEQIQKKDPRFLTEKEKALIKLMDTVYMTVKGKATIPQLIMEFGEPVIVKKYSKVEARTGGTEKPFIVVERLVDIELKFTDRIVIRGIPQKILLDIPYSGIVIKWVRHPGYKPEDMPKATKAEIRKAMAEMKV